MKKFVSIVIALVMVLSMTSAFAAPIKKDCAVLDFTYDCAADLTWCGKGAVEVVPYAKTAIACAPYWEWTVNDCAGIMASEEAYYAIKLTVEAYPDPAWWAAASLYFELDGLKDGVIKDEMTIPGISKLKDLKANLTDDEETVWYLTYDKGTKKFGWVEEDDFNPAKHLFKNVANSSDATVCAYLESYNNGLNADGYEYDGYLFKPTASTLEVSKGGKKIVFADGLKADGTAGQDGIIDSITADGKKAPVDTDFYAEVTGKFNLGCAIGTCINADNWEKIFGWDDSFKDCNPWGAVQSVIVNPECSVEIPKTGDVSVVAYAVMAIVAAAGTMLKK